MTTPRHITHYSTEGTAPSNKDRPHKTPKSQKIPKPFVFVNQIASQPSTSVSLLCTQTLNQRLKYWRGGPPPALARRRADRGGVVIALFRVPDSNTLPL